MSSSATKSFSSTSGSTSSGNAPAWGARSTADRNAALATTSAASRNPPGFVSSSSSSSAGPKQNSRPGNPPGFTASSSSSARPSSSSKPLPKVQLELDVHDPEEHGTFVGDYARYSEMSDDITGSVTILSNNVIQVKDIKCAGGLAMTEPELQAVGIWIVEQLEQHYGVELDKTAESVYANIPANVAGEPIRHGQLHYKDVRVMEYMVKATMGEKRDIEIEEETHAPISENSTSAWDAAEPVSWNNFMDSWADSSSGYKRFKTVNFEPWFPLVTFVFPSNRVDAARSTYVKEQGLGPQDQEDVEKEIPGKLVLTLGRSFAQIKPDKEGNVYDPYTLSSLFRTRLTNLPNSFYMKLLDAVQMHFGRYNYSKSVYHPDATKDNRGRKTYHEAVPLYPLCSFSNNGMTVFVQFAQGLSDAADARKISTIMPYSIPYENSETGKMDKAEGILVFKHALLNDSKDEHEKIPHPYKYGSGFCFTGAKKGGKPDNKGKGPQRDDKKKEYPKREGGKPVPGQKKDDFASMRSRKFNNNEGEKSWRQPQAGQRRGGFGAPKSNGFGGLSME